MGNRPAAENSNPSRLREQLRWVPLAAALAAAALGAVLAHGAALAAVYVVVLAAVAGLAGWRIGDGRRAALQRQIDDRSGELRRALTELEIAQSETVRRLSMAVEFRDEDTGAHIERIGRFSTLLAERVGLPPEFCERLSYAAPLHDVGKVAIPDAILLKPGPLTPEERAIVETHAEEGHRLLRGSSSSILDMAATIALSHHEKWDGGGYPRGLAGEEIPLEGRIVAIADVFDALTSDRVYRLAHPVEEAVRLMREQRAIHFDPVLLDIFLEVLSRSGPDAREQLRSDPQTLLREVLKTYSTALERGDAETAEGAIAQAIEDEIPPATLHAEVIAPALQHIGELYRAGEIDVETEHLATGITRRILATMFRYMLSAAGPPRGRVLLAGMEGEEHTLGLQMVHDQLAAAGCQTTIDIDLSNPRLLAAIEHHAPDVLVIGATTASAGAPLERALDELRESHPNLPVLLGSAAAGAAPEELQRAHPGVPTLRRIDGALAAVDELMAAREHALG
ncbi:MAG TPA: HD domain-containing phosphohydrolase [Solirubrobacteraceae bacterium]|nr:HD domain-containing phosphohydrolase [Solirubrobacteraceae bacterium]